MTLGHAVCDWIERHCVYPTGEFMGQPFLLLDWQREWIEELYRCDEDGNLQYQWALLGVPKKNGKSSLIAALGLYHLLGDSAEADPWVVVAAASDKQADIVFNAAKRMCEYSPTLRDATIRYRWEIILRDGPGKLERVAASAGKLDGKNISFLILDELHEWNQENWTILTNGTVGRRRAQIVQITTAGWDRESVCYVEYEKGLRIQAGEVQNPSYFFRWYGAPEQADHRNEDEWEDANPSYGSLVTAERLRDKLANVPESEFRRYFLNQWVEVENLWLPAGAWEECLVEEITLRPDVPTFIGWDDKVRLHRHRCGARSRQSLHDQGVDMGTPHRFQRQPDRGLGDPRS
jgi:phage terminase large subunit-like protein